MRVQVATAGCLLLHLVLCGPSLSLCVADGELAIAALVPAASLTAETTVADPGLQTSRAGEALHVQWQTNPQNSSHNSHAPNTATAHSARNTWGSQPCAGLSRYRTYNARLSFGGNIT